MIWDVDVVLSHIRRMEDNDELSFQLLSHKLVMLMAVTNADRCSDMAALDLTYQSYQGNRVKFGILGLTKTSHSGPPTEAFYPAFAAVPKLCPVWILQCYERRSEKLGTNSSSTPQKALFISVRRPHKPVKPATIGHWLKRIMKSAGIDTDSFSAHSTCCASTSKAKAAEVPTADILKAANSTISQLTLVDSDVVS